jgi:hypothetical protein
VAEPAPAADDLSREYEERRFIEEFGVLLEMEGLPRMAGRLLGRLLLCDPAEQTAEQLAEVVGASKASVSTTTRLLIHLGLVERVSLPGVRRDYFRIRPNAIGNLMRSSMTRIHAGRALTERGLLLARGDLSRLRDWYDIYTFFERELPPLIDRWEAERPSGAS